MIHFDTILNEMGGVGLAQIIFLLLLSYSMLPLGINGVATVFIAYTPDYRCNVPPLDNETAYNLTESVILNLTTPFDSSSEDYDGCYRYGYDLDTCHGDTSCVNKSYPAIPCDKGYYYDRSLFTENIITEFDLVCDRKYLNTLSTSLYYAGILIGSLIFGHVADTFGRKTCNILCTILTLGCMIALVFSNSVVLYIIFRVCLATVSYGINIAVYVYVTEIVAKEYRLYFGIMTGVVFGFGQMVLSGIAYGWRNWHEMMVAAIVISAPFLLFCFVVPESPRWLLANNKEEEGRKVVEKIARINKRRISEETWSQAKKAGEEAEKTKGEEKKKKHNSLDLFRTTPIRLITLNVMFNWFVNSFVYYGISLNAGALAGDIFLNNFLLALFDVVAHFYCMALINRIGRRILLSSSLFIAGGGLIASVIVNLYADDDQGLITFGVVLAFIAKFGISASFSTIYGVTVELYPTVLRSNGVGIGSVAGRVGGIIAPYLISLQDYVFWLPNAIFGTLGIVAGLLSLLFPETAGHDMTETIEDAEKFYSNRGKKDVITEEKEISSQSYQGEQTRF